MRVLRQHHHLWTAAARKATDRLVAELEALRRLGWQGMVFVVDDNFIGNHKRALELARAIIDWQAEHKQPFSFFTRKRRSIWPSAPT